MKKTPIFLITSLLLIIGIIFISITSLSEANSTIGDKYFFIKKQLMWLSGGLFVYLIVSKINLEYIKKLALPAYIISIILLVLVLIPGLGNQALGARRWLNLGIFSIQPTEILKFASILYFPILFSQEKNRTLKNLIIYLSIPFFLIIIEPNLSTALLISGIVISIYYASGGEIIGLIKIFPIIIVLSFILIFSSPYRMARFKSLINPNEKQTASSYHTNQIRIALGSGGLFGKGFANSEQKNKYLPKVSTDSILAVIGEETGFIGISFILYLYTALITSILKLSRTIKDEFQSLVLLGIACWIAFQTIINISAIAAIIPLTGVPLPFISYGGSSLLTLIAAIGIIKNIEKQQSKLLYSNSDNENKKNNHHRDSHNPSHRINKTITRR